MLILLYIISVLNSMHACTPQSIALPFSTLFPATMFIVEEDVSYPIILLCSVRITYWVSPYCWASGFPRWSCMFPQAYCVSLQILETAFPNWTTRRVLSIFPKHIYKHLWWNNKVLVKLLCWSSLRAIKTSQLLLNVWLPPKCKVPGMMVLLPSKAWAQKITRWEFLGESMWTRVSHTTCTRQ